MFGVVTTIAITWFLQENSNEIEGIISKNHAKEWRIEKKTTKSCKIWDIEKFWRNCEEKIIFQNNLHNDVCWVIWSYLEFHNSDWDGKFLKINLKRKYNPWNYCARGTYHCVTMLTIVARWRVILTWHIAIKGLLCYSLRFSWIWEIKLWLGVLKRGFQRFISHWRPYYSLIFMFSPSQLMVIVTCTMSSWISYIKSFWDKIACTLLDHMVVWYLLNSVMLLLLFNFSCYQCFLCVDEFMNWY